MGFPDFNEFLHALRTKELRNMPAGARVLLSAGCSGRWYFDWIYENYPGIKKHLGIEAYSPKPDELPVEAAWLPDFLYDMKSVGDNEMDLVFAGQTVEHLWPQDLAGFLCEVHRVLKPGGWFVLDSPNRTITQAIGWWQPEHTMEFSVAEAVDLLYLAGFRVLQVKGVWLCYSRETHKYLPLEPDLINVNLKTDSRVINAKKNPEDCFIWWIEAKKDVEIKPNRQKIQESAQTLYDRIFTQAIQRTFSQTGAIFGFGDNRVINAVQLNAGFLRFGPYIPLKPGKYIAQFEVAECDCPMDFRKEDYQKIALILDVSADLGKTIIAKKELTVRDLIHKTPFLTKIQPKPIVNKPIFIPHNLNIEIDKVTFGTEFRAFSTGILSIMIKEDVRLFDLNFLSSLKMPQ